MSYIGKAPGEHFTSFQTETFSVSATTSYTLSYAVANENELALFINNVRQQPGSGKAYTAAGTALTLSAATASTDTMYAIYLGRALQTITPATNSITSDMLASTFISGETALTSAPADTDEFLVSDAGVLKRIDYSLIKASNTPRFQVGMSGNQSTSTDTATLVAFATEVIDSATAFTNTASNYKFTVPSGEDGVYFFYAAIKFDDLSDNNAMTVYLYKNGSSIHEGGERTPGNAQTTEVSAMLNLAEDDYIQVYGAQNSNANKNIVAGTASQFFGFKLV